MQRRTVLAALLAAASLPQSASAQEAPDAAPACAAPGSMACPTFVRYVNHKYGFSVDVPAFFTKKPGDADGRGQPFEYGSKVRVRAWAMYDNPPMTARELYADWSRRGGITYKTLFGGSWIVRGREGGHLYYSRSILSEGLITTIEVSYDSDLADAMEPMLARMGASLLPIPGMGLRGKTH